jgi:hypothetical protein
MLADSIAIGLMARQKHHEGRTWQREVVHLVAARKQRTRMTLPASFLLLHLVF